MNEALRRFEAGFSVCPHARARVQAIGPERLKAPQRLTYV